MKKVVCFLLALMAVVSVAAEDRKKVAVVLSGGGAKGMAHIGALKVIERAGIPVDIVTGTSMGSLVGGLYAIGYDAKALDSLVRVQDWTYLLSDKEELHRQSLETRKKKNTYMLSLDLTGGKPLEGSAGVIKGRNIERLLRQLCRGYNDSIDFNKLPIPFACVATDIVSFEEVDFHSGRLPQAMRASMAIPAVFSPVRVGEMVLVDGGMRNNYPADIAKAMGADIIIGVDVAEKLKKADQLNSTVSMLTQIIDMNTRNKYEENVGLTDIHIYVDPKNYSAASFNEAAIDTLLRWGEERAMEHWDELVALKDSLGVTTSRYHSYKRPQAPSIRAGKVKLVGVKYENMTDEDIRYLSSKFDLDRLDSIDTRDEAEINSAMRLDLFYQTATSRLVKEGDGYRLLLVAGNRKTTEVNVGFRFDTEEMVALQANISLPLKKTLSVSSDLTLRLGKRLMAGGELTLHPRALRLTRPTLSYFFRRNDIDVYLKGDREYSVLYNHHQANFYPINLSIHNFHLMMGVRWDYFHFSNKLQSSDSRVVEFDNDNYFMYRAQVDYNSEDEWYFPTRGARFLAGYAYITDNFAQFNGRAGISDVNASWRKSFAMGNRFTFQPMFYGRLLFGTDIPHIYGNVLGGLGFGHYIEQQMPFVGMGHMEYAERYFIGIQLQGQQHIGKNHYVLVKTALAQHADDLKNIMKTKSLLGGELAYYYNTMFGPLGATLGYANRSKTPYFCINLGYVF